MKRFFGILLAAALMAGPALCSNVAAQEEAPQVAAPAANTRVYVKIEQAPDIEGMLVDLEQLELETSFGTVPVPVETIDGIKMNVDPEGTTVVAFRNGDVLTGKLTIETVKVRTTWGTAHINASAVDAVTMTADGRFFLDNSGGVRTWRFSKVEPVQQQPRTQRNVQPINPGTRFGG
ncbi:MAG: hypothetical protein AAF456_03710 [Planctomycetota bacterium]